MWGPNRKLRDFNTLEEMQGRAWWAEGHTLTFPLLLEGHICSWMSVDDFTGNTKLFCQAADAVQLPGLATV